MRASSGSVVPALISVSRVAVPVVGRSHVVRRTTVATDGVSAGGGRRELAQRDPAGVAAGVLLARLVRHDDLGPAAGLTRRTTTRSPSSASVSE